MGREALQFFQPRSAPNLPEPSAQGQPESGFYLPLSGRAGSGGWLQLLQQHQPHTPRLSPGYVHQGSAEQEIPAIQRRHKTDRYLAYCPGYTNTYGPLAKLERHYREALELPEGVGLSVATRPVCRTLTVAPQWSVNKTGLVSQNQRELELRDTWQGRAYPEGTQ